MVRTIPRRPFGKRGFVGYWVRSGLGDIGVRESPPAGERMRGHSPAMIRDSVRGLFRGCDEAMCGRLRSGALLRNEKIGTIRKDRPDCRFNTLRIYSSSRYMCST